MISNQQTRLLFLSLQGSARPTSTHLLSACLSWQTARKIHTSGPEDTEAAMLAIQHSSSTDPSLASSMLQNLNPTLTQPVSFDDLHATTVASSWIFPAETSMLQISSSATPAPFCDLPEWDSSSSVCAASSAEQLAMFFSPTQLGVQFWEGVHTASALPWWASIPLATIGLRALLLPLTLKARAASTHAELLHHAVQQARAAASGLDITTAKSLGRVKLVKRIYHQLRTTHNPPAISWYITNSLIQLPIFLALTSALRQMSTGMWPGLSTEGLPFYTDLTSPAVFLETMSTPFGSAGAVLPLAITLAYINIIDRSSGGQSPGINTAMKLLGIPVYGLSLLQPHSTLLFWLTTALLHQTMQRVTSKPAMGRSLGMPEMLFRGPKGTILQAAASSPPLSEKVLAAAAAVAALNQPPSASLLRVLAMQYNAEGATSAAAALLTKASQAGAVSVMAPESGEVDDQSENYEQTLVTAREDALHALRLQPGNVHALLAVATCQAALTNPAHRTSLDIFLNDCATAETACLALSSSEQRVATVQALVKLVRQVESRLDLDSASEAGPGEGVASEGVKGSFSDSEARASLQQQVARLQQSLQPARG